MQVKELLNRFFIWRDAHIKERHFLIIVCFLVGILTALAAFALKTAIHFFQTLLTEHFSQETVNFSYLLFPIAASSSPVYTCVTL